jgi:chorismate mutase
LTKEIGRLSSEEKEKLLTKLRNEVDKVDAEIIDFLIKRINLSVEIGKIKRSLALKTYDAEREKEIDNNIDRLSENPDIKKSLKRIYERIIDESRAIQRAREK